MLDETQFINILNAAEQIKWTMPGGIIMRAKMPNKKL